MTCKENITRMLEISDSFLELVVVIYQCAMEKKYVQCKQYIDEILEALKEITPVLAEIDVETKESHFGIMCENMVYSVEGLLKLERVRSKKIFAQLEFETMPMMAEFKDSLLFYSTVKDISEKEFFLNGGFSEGINPYVEESEKTGFYKYELSVIVTCYNQIKYTKACIESLLRYIPRELDYELIVIDNGSTDETKEYLKSLDIEKTINFKNNAISNLMISYRIMEGRYNMTVSNDVMITKNSINNMMKCIRADVNIGMVVPTTTNVSNLQTIDCEFEDINGMYQFAARNNESAANRWEQRTRLCNPICLFPTHYIIKNGIMAVDFWQNGQFADDLIAIYIRRSERKLILAKDSFCYHFGSITYKTTMNLPDVMYINKNKFTSYMGIDPWGTGFCYDFYMSQMVKLKLNGSVNILGINPGFGSNPLKIKELHRENGNENIIMKFIATTNLYYEDWKAIADERVVVKDTYEIIKTIEKTKYDFICLEDYDVPFAELKKLILVLKETLAVDGTLCLKIENKHIAEISKRLEGAMLSQGDEKWIVWRKESDDGVCRL